MDAHRNGDIRTSGTSKNPDTVEVIRSEERLDVVTRSEVVGRIRVAKRVVTEERVVTVTVRREELVVEQFPVEEGAVQHGDLLVERAGDGSGPAHDASPVLELLLSEEQVEVVTRVVPRERVKVFVDTLTESVEVSGTVAREVVDVEGV